MNIYEYIWIYLNIFISFKGYILILYDYIIYEYYLWIFMNIFEYIWIFMNIFISFKGYILILYDYIIYEYYLWIFMNIFEYIWIYLNIYEYIYIVLKDISQLFNYFCKSFIIFIIILYLRDLFIILFQNIKKN
jgi:hypothetical protein